MSLVAGNFKILATWNVCNAHYEPYI